MLSWLVIVLQLGHLATSSLAELDDARDTRSIEKVLEQMSAVHEPYAAPKTALSRPACCFCSLENSIGGDFERPCNSRLTVFDSSVLYHHEHKGLCANIPTRTPIIVGNGAYARKYEKPGRRLGNLFDDPDRYIVFRFCQDADHVGGAYQNFVGSRTDFWIVNDKWPTHGVCQGNLIASVPRSPRRLQPKYVCGDADRESQYEFGTEYEMYINGSYSTLGGETLFSTEAQRKFPKVRTIPLASLIAHSKVTPHIYGLPTRTVDAPPFMEMNYSWVPTRTKHTRREIIAMRVKKRLAQNANVSVFGPSQDEEAADLWRCEDGGCYHDYRREASLEERNTGVKWFMERYLVKDMIERRLLVDLSSEWFH